MPVKLSKSVGQSNFDWYLVYFGNSNIKIAHDRRSGNDDDARLDEEIWSCLLVGTNEGKRGHNRTAVSLCDRFRCTCVPLCNETATHTHTHTHTAKHADFLGCNVNAGEDRKRGLLDQQRRFPRAIDFVNYRDRSKHGRAVYGFHIWRLRVVSSASETRETSGHLSKRDRVHDARE